MNTRRFHPRQRFAAGLGQIVQHAIRHFFRHDHRHCLSRIAIGSSMAAHRSFEDALVFR